MKRPEETAYPSKRNVLETSKRMIEHYIEQNKFTFSCHGIVQTPALENWLKEWGWRIEYHMGHYGDESYYTLKEL